jgi:ArsR family transcriptional regulator
MASLKRNPKLRDFRPRGPENGHHLKNSLKNSLKKSLKNPKSEGQRGLPAKVVSHVTPSSCEQISGIFKYLGHPQRLQLLLCLRQQGELTVTELVKLTLMSQSQVSQTLQKMKLSGILDSERNGTNIHYRIKCQQLKSLLKGIERIYPGA